MLAAWGVADACTARLPSCACFDGVFGGLDLLALPSDFLEKWGSGSDVSLLGIWGLAACGGPAVVRDQLGFLIGWSCPDPY